MVAPALPVASPVAPHGGRGLAEVRATAERRVGAPAAWTYRCVADEREHHHRFLPPAFSGWRIEQAGIGAGTVVRFQVTLDRLARDYLATIAEPEPGRVLTESDPEVGTVTTFTVTPDGAESRMRIETAWTGVGGVAGVAERLRAPRPLGRLDADELARLDRYAREQGA